jgi:hypothetical protein
MSLKSPGVLESCARGPSVPAKAIDRLFVAAKRQSKGDGSKRSLVARSVEKILVGMMLDG